MSLIGVFAAILLLIILIYKRVHLILASLSCVLVLALTGGFSFMDLTMNYYAISLANFIAKYIMVFVTNALFGKVMEETLLVSAFSKMIGKLFGDKNAAYGALIVTALLSYGGISAFVIVFTVYPIFLATFKKADLPRKLIPACIMAASCTFPLSMLPGGAQLNNIIPAQYLGTSPMAAPLVSMIASVITATLMFLYFRYEFAKARRRGEHFEAEGDILCRIEQFEKDPGLRPWTSVLPMVLIILFINLFGMDLSYAVLAGTVLALVLGWKNLTDTLRTFNEGVAKVGPAMITTAASVGFGGAVLACAGAQTILETIASLPVNPTISLSLAASFAGILTGNGGGGADVAMNILSGQYLAMGVQPEILHRVVAIATAGFSCLPHNGMLITVSDTCGFSAKECYRYIFISTVLVSFAGLIVTVGLGCLLYPVG